MKNPQEAAGIPELREFVREYAERVYQFVYYVVHDPSAIGELLLPIFREFGELYRRQDSKGDANWKHLEWRVQLFRLAWESIRAHSIPVQTAWLTSQDLKRFDEDLLRALVRGEKLVELDEALASRLRRVDLEYRAAVVLHDILGMEDQEVVRILGLRWGVYRHRLHRGRIDFKDELKGRRARVGDTETKPRETTW